MLRFITAKRSKKRLTVEVILVLSLFASITSFMYLRSAFGATYTWDGEGTTNDWSDCDNWSSNTCPGASDIAAFDNTSDKDATIDASFGGSVLGVSILSGYDGTITQSRSLTVGSSSFSQASGIWDGGSQTLQISENFTVSGGTHNATTGTWNVERNFTYSGGTLNMPSSTVTLTSSHYQDHSVISCSGEIQGEFASQKDDVSSSFETDIEIGSGCEITFVSNFTTESSITVEGTLNATDITLDAHFTQNGTLNMTGTLFVVTDFYQDATTISCSGVFGPDVNLNRDDSSSGTGNPFTVGSGCEVTVTDGSFSYGSVIVNGTMNATNLTVFNDFTNNGTVNMIGTLTMGGGSFQADGTITCNSGVLSTGLLNVQINKTNGTFAPPVYFDNNCTITGDLIRTDGVLGNPGSPVIVTIEGDITISTSDAFGGANLTLEMGGTDTQNITQNAGTFSSPLTVNKSSGTVILLTALTLADDLTITSGEFQNDTFSLNVSDVLTVNGVFTQGTGHVTVGTLTVGATGDYSNPSTGNLIIGAGGVSNSGSITIGTFDACPTSDGRAITSSSPTTQRTWSGSGTANIYDTQITDQGGTATVNAFSSTDVSGNGTNVTFYVDCSIPVRPYLRGGTQLRGGSYLD